MISEKETCVYCGSKPTWPPEREFFIDNLLVRIHCIIVMIRWTGLAPLELEFPFPGSLTSTFLVRLRIFNDETNLTRIELAGVAGRHRQQLFIRCKKVVDERFIRLKQITHLRLHISNDETKLTRVERGGVAWLHSRQRQQQKPGLL